MKKLDHWEQYYQDIFNNIFLSYNNIHSLSFVGLSSRESEFINNFARISVKNGKKTIVVDSDLISGLSGNNQNTSFLKNISKVDDVDVDYLKTSGTEESIEPKSYPINVNQLVLDLQQQYDFIIFDCKELASSQISKIISRHVDGTILLIKVGVSTEKELQIAERKLGYDSKPVLGAVLTNVKIRRFQNKEFYGVI